MTSNATETLVSMVNGFIRRLRQTSQEPFQIEVSDKVYVEILPIGYLDDRVYVGKRGHGFTEVNYSDDGLNVEVLQEAEATSIHGAAIYNEDLTGDRTP